MVDTQPLQSQLQPREGVDQKIADSTQLNLLCSGHCSKRVYSSQRRLPLRLGSFSYPWDQVRHRSVSMEDTYFGSQFQRVQSIVMGRPGGWIGSVHGGGSLQQLLLTKQESESPG